MANDVLLNTTTDLNGKTLVTAEGDRSITGLLTYSRGASAPFAVGSGAASVANLDADKLDGLHAPTTAIVGIGDTQTLSSKTLNTPTIVGATITGTPSIDVITLTGGQINFPAAQNASTGVNVLDDYEEGTWTPTIGGSTSQSGQTYSLQNGYYVKIGKFVWANFGIGITLKGTITGSVQIQGLPFTIENLTNNFGFAVVQFNGLATNWVSVYGIGIANGTAITLRGSTVANTTNATDLVTADAANGMSFFGSICYKASA